MIGECPVAKGKGKGSGAQSSRSYFEDFTADLAPGQEHLAGVGFHYHSEPVERQQNSWHEHSLSFAATDNELAIVPYEGNSARDGDTHTRVVHSCEHYDMSLSDDDEQLDQA